MNQNLLITIFSLTILLLISPVSGQRPDKLTYKGKIYQVTEIVEVNGQNATLKTTEVQKDGTKKLVTIPIRFLSTRFKLKAESIQKGTGKFQTALSVVLGNASETEKAIQQSIIEGTALKRWVKGIASNEQIEEGTLVVSTSSALELKINRSGEALPPKKVKGNAIFYNGLVMIKDLKVKVGIQEIKEGEGDGLGAGGSKDIDKLVWDTGEKLEYNGETVPIFSLKKTKPKPLVDERSWTNLDGKTLVASLVCVIDEVGRFERSNRSVFSYAINKLSEEDQNLIKDTIEKRYKELKSTL